MKKSLLGLSLLLAVCAFAQQPVTVTVTLPVQVQKGANISSGSVASINKAFTSNVTAGNTLIVSFCNGNGNAPTAPITDTLTNTWTKAVHIANSTTFECDIWFAVNSPAGANTVTVTPGGTNASIAMEIYEYSGFMALIPAQGDIATSATGTSATASTIELANENGANSVAIGALGIGTAAQTATVGTGWTNDSGQQNPTTPSGLFSFVSFSQMLDDPDAVTPSATFTSEPWAMATAVFHSPQIPVNGAVRAYGTTPRYQETAKRCTLVSAASTNATNCKAGSGNVYGFRFVNTTATVYYLRMYNLAAAPTCSSATGFIESIPIPASTSGAGVVSIEPMGEGYDTGIGFCFTGGSSSTDNTNAATGVFGTILYR